MVDVAKVIPGVHASILKIYSHVCSHFCADATLDLVACETRQQAAWSADVQTVVDASGNREIS